MRCSCTRFPHAGTPYCPTIEHVITNKVHTLSCVSYDSPPTEVIWERDGERIYFNDTSSDVYHSNQVLLNRTTSAYNNTLTINATIEDVRGDYSCTVLNSVGQSDKLIKTVKGEAHHLWRLIAIVVLSIRAVYVVFNCQLAISKHSAIMIFTTALTTRLSLCM